MDSGIDVIPQRCILMTQAVHPFTCIAIKSQSIKLILTDMTPSNTSSRDRSLTFYSYCAETYKQAGTGVNTCALTVLLLANYVGCIDMILKHTGFSFIPQKVDSITRSCVPMRVHIASNSR